jgi:hypothetical protein
VRADVVGIKSCDDEAARLRDRRSAYGGHGNAREETAADRHGSVVSATIAVRIRAFPRPPYAVFPTSSTTAAARSAAAAR